MIALVAPAKARLVNPDFWLNGINCGELAEYYAEYVASLSGSRANAYKVGFFKGYIWAHVLADGLNDPQDMTVEQVLHFVGGHAKANYGMWKKPANQCVMGALKRLAPESP